MKTWEAGDQFLRRNDPQPTRRNYRRVQVQRILAITSNILIAVVFLLAVGWLWQTTQRNERFAIREVQTVGADNTAETDLDLIAEQYVGQNLFRIDIERLKAEFNTLPWVASVAIEKELPGRLTIHVTERVPVAVVSLDGMLRYADAEGVVFGELGPRHGSMDLPVIIDAPINRVPACIAMLESVQTESRELYSHISEIAPADGATWRIWDRKLAATVYLASIDSTRKWRALHAIAARDGLGKGTIEYADLRFEDRVIVRPRKGIVPLHEIDEEEKNGSPSDGSGRPGNA
jgi:cell division protein FtsQ